MYGDWRRVRVHVVRVRVLPAGSVLLCTCGPPRHGVETETLPCVRRHCRLCDDSHCLCCGLNGVVLVGVGVRGYVATDFKSKAYAYNESVCINMYMYVYVYMYICICILLPCRVLYGWFGCVHGELGNGKT